MQIARRALPLALTLLGSLALAQPAPAQTLESEKISFLPAPGFETVLIGQVDQTVDSVFVSVASSMLDFSANQFDTQIFTREPVTGALVLDQTITLPSSVFLSAEDDEALFGGSDPKTLDLYKRGSDGQWAVSSTLGPDDPETVNFLVSGVRRGNVAAFGATLTDGSRVVYVLGRDPLTGVWTQEAKLSPSVGGDASDFNFGVNLDVAENLLVVGNPQIDADGTGDGAVFVFRKQGGSWSETQVLLGADFSGLLKRGGFGQTVAIDDDSLFVAEPFAGPFFSSQGVVHRYEIGPSGLTPQQTLLSPQPSANQSYGQRLKADAGLLVAGVGPSSGVAGPSSPIGQAVVYEEQLDGSYALLAELAPSDPNTPGLSGVPNSFGQRVAVSAGRVYVARYANAFPNFAMEAALYSYESPYLALDTATLSATSGGTGVFSMDLPVAFAGSIYLLLGSLSGVDGFAVDNEFVPLGIDSYLLLTLNAPTAVGLQGSIGLLDANGDASFPWVLPPPNQPILIGQEASHAALVFDGVTGTLSTVSAPVAVGFTP